MRVWTRASRAGPHGALGIGEAMGGAVGARQARFRQGAGIVPVGLHLAGPGRIHEREVRVGDDDLGPRASRQRATHALSVEASTPSASLAQKGGIALVGDPNYLVREMQAQMRELGAGVLMGRFRRNSSGWARRLGGARQVTGAGPCVAARESRAARAARRPPSPPRVAPSPRPRPPLRISRG